MMALKEQFSETFQRDKAKALLEEEQEARKTMTMQDEQQIQVQEELQKHARASEVKLQNLKLKNANNLNLADLNQPSELNVLIDRKPSIYHRIVPMFNSKSNKLAKGPKAESQDHFETESTHEAMNTTEQSAAHFQFGKRS